MCGGYSLIVDFIVAVWALQTIQAAVLGWNSPSNFFMVQNLRGWTGDQNQLQIMKKMLF